MRLPPLRCARLTVETRAACALLDQDYSLDQRVVQVVFRRWEMGMRYGGVKLAKPPNYSAKHPRLATESGAWRVFSSDNRAASRDTSRCQSVETITTRNQAPIASKPALPICTSSVDFTPETPIAPKHWPLIMIGTPPSSIPSSVGAVMNEKRPLLIMSS